MEFPASQNAAFDRLNAFVPKAGLAYAAKRNFDVGGHPHVSGLSPYLRHRIVTEENVLDGVLRHHSAASAGKFIQEVYWRTYWKGWLEQRPAVWTGYKAELNAALNRVQTESGLRRAWEAACSGETGIDCFDHWARELASTGYLHNHARMWFASIWIFTLRLPWTLGADFFLRHLLDGDPASNTLGWRWVGGLQTIGKTYLARADNIEKYTMGRFAPKGLAPFAAPLEGPPHPQRSALPTSDVMPQSGTTGLLLTEDDLSPDALIERLRPTSIAILDGTEHRSPLSVSPKVTGFVQDAILDLETRTGRLRRVRSPAEIHDWASGFDSLALAHPPVGPAADILETAARPMIRHIRQYDQDAWRHATAGFFKFKAKIPMLLKRFERQASFL